LTEFAERVLICISELPVHAAFVLSSQGIFGLVAAV
jgi:hypothetical protein